jgi:hypothetical protein
VKKKTYDEKGTMLHPCDVMKVVVTLKLESKICFHELWADLLLLANDSPEFQLLVGTKCHEYMQVAIQLVLWNTIARTNLKFP